LPLTRKVDWIIFILLAFTMNEQESKSPADYERELRERQRLLGSDHKNRASSQLHYISQQTGKPGQFILEYSNGRRILVEIDETTGKEYFLREL
jgi:hypothetical protein